MLLLPLMLPLTFLVMLLPPPPQIPMVCRLILPMGCLMSLQYLLPPDFLANISTRLCLVSMMIWRTYLSQGRSQVRLMCFGPGRSP